jgi:hypothetical protein
MIARSSGSWPIARASVPSDARPVQCARHSGAEHASRLRSRETTGIGIHRLEEPHFGGEVFAAIRHVDRRDRELADRYCDDPVFVVEIGMLEIGSVG